MADVVGLFVLQLHGQRGHNLMRHPRRAALSTLRVINSTVRRPNEG